VACQWRVRHKLFLGFALVVGVMVLLLAGTLMGLLTITSNIKSVQSKVAELERAERFRDVAVALKDGARNTVSTDAFRRKLAEARKCLDEYEAQLNETVRRQRDPENGSHEYGLVEVLRKDFAKIDEGQVRFVTEQTEQVSWPAVAAVPGVNLAAQDLVNTTDELRERLYQHIKDIIRDARAPYTWSLIIVISTSITGVCLMAGLLRFFYGWIFSPLRDLQQGAGRVAHGDFDRRIEVHSGDEMEELATAFNNMTSRLQEIYRNLEHQVNERSRQLVRSERLASVGFLAAGVSHEINNPLASIAFCSEALESRLAEVLAKAPNEGDVVKKYLRMIQQEAFRCKAITQRLLEFSRSAERRREATDLGELIQSVLDVVQHLQNSKGKQIVLEQAAPVVAWINAQEIKSVVLNLVVNALDSMDENGKLTITLRQRDRMAEMVFADTGCGMSGEILENIFEPFFTRSRTGKGTGLGLSISHRVVSQHGGEIEATSAGLNQGSTFTVRLPLHAAEEQGLGVRGQGLEVRDQGREGQGLEPDKGTEPRSKRMAA